MSRGSVIPQIQGVLALDRTIHEPARYAILAILMSVEYAEFTYLRAQTGLTQGNLSAHLTKLEAAGLVKVDKSFEGKRPKTTLSITPDGIERVIAHSKELARFLDLIGVKASAIQKYQNRKARR